MTEPSAPRSRYDWTREQLADLLVDALPWALAVAALASVGVVVARRRRASTV